MGAQRGSQLTGSASRPAAAGGETSSGRVFWITGLSGAGKTTIGRELWRRLRAAGHSAIFLDGDALREVIAERSWPQPQQPTQIRDAQRAIVPDACPVRAKTSSARPFRCSTRCSAGIAKTSRAIARSIFACRWTNCAVGTPRASTRRLTEAIYVTSSALTCRRSCPRHRTSRWIILGRSTALPRWTASGRNASCGTVPRRTAALPLVVRHQGRDARSAGAARCAAARILPQVRFSVAEWRADRARVLAKIAAERWSSRPVIVRSSARGEDGPVSSQAGRYDSVLGVLRQCGHRASDRPGHRFLRRGRKRQRPGFRAAHARSRRHGRRGLLAPTQRRRPLLHRQLR